MSDIVDISDLKDLIDLDPILFTKYIGSLMNIYEERRDNDVLNEIITFLDMSEFKCGCKHMITLLPSKYILSQKCKFCGIEFLWKTPENIRDITSEYTMVVFKTKTGYLQNLKDIDGYLLYCREFDNNFDDEDNDYDDIGKYKLKQNRKISFEDMFVQKAEDF